MINWEPAKLLKVSDKVCFRWRDERVGTVTKIENGYAWVQWPENDYSVKYFDFDLQLIED